jgi:hypothetical protein
MRKAVAVIVAALYLAACGAPASISGSSVKRPATMAQADAVDVAVVATRAPVAAEAGGQPTAPVGHPANPAAQTPAVQPAASPPAAEPDRTMPGFSCESFNGPGRPKVMCAPQ